MTHHYAACVARFRNPAGEPCGTGFLIDHLHVMTCAIQASHPTWRSCGSKLRPRQHVINAALGCDRELTCSVRPEGSLYLDLPLVGITRAEAEVADWYAPVAYEKRHRLRVSPRDARIGGGNSAPLVFRSSTGSRRMARRRSRIRAGGSTSGKTRITAT